jgi:hypothetical protein
MGSVIKEKNMKAGDLVSVVTMSGEYIGKYAESETGLRLDNPRMIVQAPNGGMGFAKGVAVTGKVDPEYMQINSYVFVCETNEDVKEAYMTAFSGIQVPKKKKIIVNK